MASSMTGPSITGGPQQLIGGIPYTQGSPEALAALNEQQIKQAGVAGTAAGTAAGNENTTASEIQRQYDLLHPSIASQQEQSTFYDNQLGQRASLQGLQGVVGKLGSVTNSLTGSMNGGSNGTAPLNLSTPAPMSGGTSAPASVAPIAPVDMTASNSAAFGRAKDQVGQETSGALAGLRSSLGGRGLLGSGAESRGTAAVINKGQGELGDTSRQQAITGTTQDQQVAEANQGAAITGRGQDISAADSARSAALAARGQDITAQNDRNNLVLEQSAQQQQTRQASLNGLISALGAMTSAVRAY